MPPLSGKKPSDMKTTSWMMVYWLTEGRTREGFDALVQQMPSDWHVEGQVECGKTSEGKEHLQLYLKTPQTRGTRIQKFFPGAIFDEARNQFALQNYVHKEDTRIAEFKTVENRSPQWHVVRDQFYEWFCSAHADLLAYRIEDEEKLKYWDHFIGISLEEGMNVDVIGVNPQYRSCIMKYWYHMVRRVLSKNPPTVDKCLDKTAAGGVSPGGGRSSVKKVIKTFVPKE